MIEVMRTVPENKDFIQLITKLDAYLKITDEDEHDFYNQFNGISDLNHVVVAYDNGKAVGCGTFKEFDSTSVEIKRMFTASETRGKGVGTEILKALELWASELDYSYCIVETGVRQKEAVQFYQKCYYKSIPNYGPYIGMNNSLCFKKKLS